VCREEEEEEEEEESERLGAFASTENDAERVSGQIPPFRLAGSAIDGPGKGVCRSARDSRR
jgi:hypothetical protein